MAVDERKPIKGLYNGYMNYYQTKDPLTLKSYNFSNLTKAQVDALQSKFSGPSYRFVGKLSIKNKD
jgi:hypothetical protein